MDQPPANAQPLPTDLGPPPRVVRSIGLRATAGLWFVRLFILPHTLVGLGAAGYWLVTVLWFVAGSDLPARVIGGHMHTSRKGGTTYNLKYQLPVGPKLITATASVSEDQYRYYLGDAASVPAPSDTPRAARTPPPPLLHEDPLIIRYLSLGPIEQYDPPGKRAYAKIGFLLLWASFWNGILSVFIWQMWVVPLRTRWLYKRGHETPGTLTGKRQTRGKGTSYFLQYIYTDAQGQTHNREMQCHNQKIWAPATVGENVRVLYAPENPRHSVIYEYGLYRVVSPTDAPPLPLDSPPNPYAGEIQRPQGPRA